MDDRYAAGSTATGPIDFAVPFVPPSSSPSISLGMGPTLPEKLSLSRCQGRSAGLRDYSFIHSQLIHEEDERRRYLSSIV